MRGLLPLLLTAAWASNPLFCPDQTVTITLDFSGIKYKNDGSTLRSVVPSFLYFMPLKSSVMVTVWSGQKRGLDAHAAVMSGSNPRILASPRGMLGSQ